MGEIVRPNNGSGRDVPAVMRDLGVNDVDDAIQCLELGWIVKEIRVHGCLKTLFVEIQERVVGYNHCGGGSGVAQVVLIIDGIIVKGIVGRTVVGGGWWRWGRRTSSVELISRHGHYLLYHTLSLERDSESESRHCLQQRER